MSHTEADEPAALQPTPLRLLGTLALVALAIGCRLLAGSSNLPFLFFFPSIIVIAWYAGTACAILALVIESLVAGLVLAPSTGSSLAWVRVLLFMLGSVLIVWVSHVLHRTRAGLISAKRREERQRRHYEILLDSIAEGVITLDAAGAIGYLNQAARSMLASDARNVLGQPLLQVAHFSDESNGKAARDLEALSIEGVNWALIAPGQEPVPVVMSIAKMRSDEAGDSGTVLVLRQAFAERERERLNLDTEAARADAEAANRMKDDFLRMVSHELRAPLNAILGWADVMMRKNDAATVAKGCETIRRNVRAQSSLIDSMLDVAAIASGRFTIARRPTDIVDVMEEAHRSIEPIAQAKKITLVRDIEAHAPPLSADTPRLQQVLANLYSNAIKFTPSGGTITTRLKFEGRQFVIEVEDTGQGMNAETAALLFERSASSNTSLARSKSGLGLGLRIARRIVELHGGHLSATSPGEHLGTKVSVAIPADAPVGDAPVEPQEDLAPLVGKRILVVDDDTQAALLLANVLDDIGAVVQTADTARRGLDLYTRFEPEAMVSDIGMAAEDGHWLIESIRRVEQDRRLPRMPALAVTAYARPEDRDRSRNAGFDGHLGKPVTARAVAYALAAALSRQLDSHDHAQAVQS